MRDARQPSLRGIAVLAALGFCLLTGLGLWQLRRLAQKEALLAAIAERSAAPLLALPLASEWTGLIPGDYGYRHVTASGVLQHGKEALVFRLLEGGKTRLSEPGFLVLTPLRLATGETVIVNRGFVPQALRDPATRASGQTAGGVKVTGLMRPPEPRNLFTPVDQPAQGLWYTRDPASIAAARGLTQVAPFTIDADAAPNPGGWPLGGQTVLAIRNDHLSYALTWFGLAATLLGVFAALAWKRVRP